MKPGNASHPAKSSSQSGTDSLSLVRQNVRSLLLESPAFLALPLDKQQQIAHDTVQVAHYLSEPEGMRVNGLGLPVSASKATATGLASSDTSPAPGGQQPGNTSGFTALASREGAAVAGALLQQVDFPKFVASLIDGVFDAIVTASMKQMEAYGQLVANVAKSLNQFKDENFTDNEGRDHLQSQFPDMFEIGIDTGGDNNQPRIRLKDGVDEDAALKRVNSSLPLEKPVESLDDDTVDGDLVQAARTQLATSRQQLLATLVLMGINRIVVTDGKISAKVMYDFRAQDNYKKRSSATKFDYGDQYHYTGEGTNETNVQGATHTHNEDRGDNSSKGSTTNEDHDASWYAKGNYKYDNSPVIKLMSVTNESVDATLSTKASLMGNVEINFKSDYLPLEKMADSFQISNIQNAAKPGQGRRPPGQPNAGGGQAGGAVQPGNAVAKPGGASAPTPSTG